jgi:hypothetical protein
MKTEALFALVVASSAFDTGAGWSRAHEQGAGCFAHDGTHSGLQVASVRAPVPGGGRLLVLYQYYEAPNAAQNLRYFLAKTVYEPAQQRERARPQGGSVPSNLRASHGI